MINENLSLKNKSLCFVYYQNPVYFDDSDAIEASPEEVSTYINYLYSDDDSFQDLGISFLTSAISAVNEEILTRIMSIGFQGDIGINVDFAPQILSFLGYLVQNIIKGEKQKEITLELLVKLRCLDFICIALGTGDNIEILKEGLKALNKYINIEMFAFWFVKNNIFQRLLELLKYILEKDDKEDEDNLIKSVEYIFNFLNYVFRTPKLYAEKEIQDFKNIIPEIYLHIFSLGQENTKKLKQSTIAMNSLQFYFSICDDNVLQTFFKTDCFVNMLYSYIQKGGNYHTILLSILLVITGHSDEVVALTIPFVTKFLELYINFNENVSVEFQKLLVGVIRNYAACDEQRILDFILSDLCTQFLLKISSPQTPYSVQVQVHLIIYFLALNQDFYNWIFNNFPIEMVTEKISDEPEYLINYFSSLISIGCYLKQTDSNNFNVFLENLQNNNIGETISDTHNNYSECEQLLSIATQLQEFLLQFIPDLF